MNHYETFWMRSGNNGYFSDMGKSHFPKNMSLKHLYLVSQVEASRYTIQLIQSLFASYIFLLLLTHSHLCGVNKSIHYVTNHLHLSLDATLVWSFQKMRSLLSPSLLEDTRYIVTEYTLPYMYFPLVSAAIFYPYKYVCDYDSLMMARVFVYYCCVMLLVWYTLEEGSPVLFYKSRDLPMVFLTFGSKVID